jgi:hypothetical protein
MAGSAKPKHCPYDPCGGTDAPFSYSTTGHYAKGPSFELDPTRVAGTAYYQLLRSS